MSEPGARCSLPGGRGTVYCLRRVTLSRTPAASEVYARFGKCTLNRPSTHTMLLGGLLHSGIVACLCIVIVKESSDLVRLTAAAGGAFPVRPIECLALLLGVPLSSRNLLGVDEPYISTSANSARHYRWVAIQLREISDIDHFPENFSPHLHVCTYNLFRLMYVHQSKYPDRHLAPKSVPF